MRLKIRLDCTGEPPGELIWIAMVGSLDRLNARSRAAAVVASDKPGRNGVAMPMGPANRSTGTMSLRLNGHMMETILTPREKPNEPPLGG
jgi:hypothetical protein